MAARAGMANLINELRSTCYAGTADFTLGTVTYWSNDQLQTALDRQRNDMFFIPIEAMTQTVNSSYATYNYQIPVEAGRWFEEIAPTANTFLVRDAAGGSVDMSSYSVNYQARVVTFSADTQGSALYLDCRAYDLYAAAADVWGQKAAYLQQNVDWQSDNHRIAASQQITQALKMRDFYKSESDSSVRSVRFYREDETADRRGVHGGYGVEPDWRRVSRDNEGWI